MNCSACTDWQYRFRCKKRGKPSELNKLHRFSFNQPKTIRLKLLLDYDTKDKRFEAPLETQSFKYQTQGCRKKNKDCQNNSDPPALTWDLSGVLWCLAPGYQQQDFWILWFVGWGLILLVPTHLREAVSDWYVGSLEAGPMHLTLCCVFWAVPHTFCCAAGPIVLLEKAIAIRERHYLDGLSL